MKAVIFSLLLVTPAFAQEAAAQSTIARLFPILQMFIMVFAIFWIIVWLPQQKKQKEQTNLLTSLTKGQEVVTNSGIIAKVAGIEEEYLLLEIAPNVRIRVVKEQIDKLYIKK